ncbi:hypothetical protein PG996_015050 [Apiospora saccharicola]|uniref:C2H2-type domain-containing protein n=1 Tax=Apiospora saccharicola TaxID=335842 RepID=A0ABR1TM62_9PEZI
MFLKYGVQRKSNFVILFSRRVMTNISPEANLTRQPSPAPDDHCCDFGKIPAEMASNQLACTGCSLTFPKEQHLERHLKMDPHNVPLKCPFPDKSCGKVYTKYSVMLNHLRKDVQDHKGMGLDEIHKLAASQGDEEANDAPTPNKWILWMYRTARRAKLGKPARSYSLRNKRRENNGQSDQVDNIHERDGGNDAAVIAKPNLTHQATEVVVEEDLIDLSSEGHGGYESEPEEWWMR